MRLGETFRGVEPMQVPSVFQIFRFNQLCNTHLTEEFTKNSTNFYNEFFKRINNSVNYFVKTQHKKEKNLKSI